MNKAAFLDRDGVINRKAHKGEYITRWEDLRFLPGVAEAIALLKQSGYLVVVITNQRCVAKATIDFALYKQDQGCSELQGPAGLAKPAWHPICATLRSGAARDDRPRRPGEARKA